MTSFKQAQVFFSFRFFQLNSRLFIYLLVVVELFSGLPIRAFG